MYFPYLRGKQFELIALREIFQFLEEGNRISPIIEPVKETTVTLEKTLTSLISHNQNFNLILNPHVGDIGEGRGVTEIIRIKDSVIRGYTNFQPTILINEKTKISGIEKIVTANKLENLCIICNSVPVSEEEFFTFLEGNSIKHVLINDSISSKRFVREIKKRDLRKVSLTDPFKSLPRNSDYLDNIDEFFSDEHLYYKEEDYIGFGDYLSIGQDYTDTGFLPYAVVIHLTYTNSRKEIRIRHFVSDSNSDTTDVAGKFAEALTKLIYFINDRAINTIACNEFREIYKNETYPGLGSIKKLSIKHHIELVKTLIS
jgi:hypothetical protein